MIMHFAAFSDQSILKPSIIKADNDSSKNEKQVHKVTFGTIPITKDALQFADKPLQIETEPSHKAAVSRILDENPCKHN